MNKAEYVFNKLAQAVAPMASSPPWYNGMSTTKNQQPWKMPSPLTVGKTNNFGKAVGAKTDIIARNQTSPVSTEHKTRLDSLLNR